MKKVLVIHQNFLWLLILAVPVLATGINTLPIDGHEAYVLQTTKEMQERHDWIVPWFNGSPRLNKPPLNYWLTGITARLSGYSNDIQPWHGRIVSFLAGFGLLLFTYLVAFRLYGRHTGITAALMMLTSLGFFNYSHDARPDMLYGFLCALGYSCFILAWKSDIQSRPWLTWGMWIAYALATLSKGPHMPAIYLTTTIIFCLCAKITARQVLYLLRPVTGVLIFACIIFPWWFMLEQRLGDDIIRGTQLTGTLLIPDFRNLLDPYYFYRPLLLILPWVVFIPFVITRMRQHRGDKTVILLILLVIIPALELTIGTQKRWYYMLPSLLPMVILLAIGAEHFFNTGKFVNLRNHFRNASLLIALLYIISAYTHYGWSKERFENYYLAIHAQKMLTADTRVAIISINPDIYVYYLGKGIIKFKTVNDLFEFKKAHLDGHYLLIMNKKEINQLPADIKWHALYTTDMAGKSKSLVELIPVSG